MLRTLLLALLCLLAETTYGHASNNAFLTLTLNDTELSGALQFRAVDLPLITALDTDGDLQLTWGEVKAAREPLAAYVAQHLRIRNDAGECRFEQAAYQVEQLSAGTYLHIPLHGTCPPAGSTVAVDYDLLFAQDSLHRGLMALQSGETHAAFVFAPDQQTADIALSGGSLWPLLRTFLEEGVWHIWMGYDHLMFLIALLIPMFLPARRADSRLAAMPGQPSASPQAEAHIVWSKAKSILQIVTAFTAAHSITLILSSLYQPPMAVAIIETLIAASVLLAGINMLRPVFDSGHWRIAFCFGLIHGLGFAAALRDLTLPTQYFIQSLLSFNVGVELGQLVIVLLVFPLLLWLSRRGSYQRYVVPGLATLVIGTSTWWMFERATQI